MDCSVASLFCLQEVQYWGCAGLRYPPPGPIPHGGGEEGSTLPGVTMTGAASWWEERQLTLALEGRTGTSHTGGGTTSLVPEPRPGWGG